MSKRTEVFVFLLITIILVFSLTPFYFPWKGFLLFNLQQVRASALTNVINTVTNTKVSTTTSHQINFTTYTTVPVDGKILITFPDSFDISKATTPAAVQQWDGSSWGGIGAGETDIAFVSLAAHPNTGTIFSLLYEDDTSTNDGLLETHLTEGGSTWSNQTTTWQGPVTRNLGLTKVSISPRIDSNSNNALIKMLFNNDTGGKMIQWRYEIPNTR